MAGVDHVKWAGLHGAGRQNQCWQSCRTTPSGTGTPPLYSSESVLKSDMLPFRFRCFSPDSGWNVNALRYLQVGILVSCSLLQINNVLFLRGKRQDMDILVPLAVTNAHAELHQFCLGESFLHVSMPRLNCLTVLGLVLIFLLGMVHFLWLSGSLM